MISIDLPFPPSVNRYWRHPTSGNLAGRHLISAKGRAYRDTVAKEVLVQRIGTQIGRLALQVDVFPPDARRRDLDNLFKSLLDALQHAGVVEDDSQFEALTIRRQHRVKGGLVQIHIKAHASDDPKQAAIDRCKYLLSRLIPFDEWCAIRPRTEWEKDFARGIKEQMEKCIADTVQLAREIICAPGRPIEFRW